MRVYCLALLAFCTLPLAAVSAQFATAGSGSLRLLSHQALVRSALDALVSEERRVSQYGVELTIPTPWPALRAEGRLLRGMRGSDDLRSIDAGLVLGWHSIGLAAAYGQRGSYDPSSGLAHGRVAEFGRVGLRLRFAEREAPFIVHLRGDAYVPTKAAVDEADAVRGWDAEGGVTWRARRWPLNASLGYRLERFRVFQVEQEVSALTFGVGVAIGGR